ncbi:hypothetical protein Scep_003982 [Stephania cephalantha]|uniref:Uncharacterized protein n=1 Tax=Stephania cephalantha TaxID=152367 RepID=A0AAP0KRJ8_9MAGN
MQKEHEERCQQGILRRNASAQGHESRQGPVEVPTQEPTITTNSTSTRTNYNEIQQTYQGYGLRLFSDTGNMYLRMPGEYVQTVVGPRAAAEAARRFTGMGRGRGRTGSEKQHSAQA